MCKNEAERERPLGCLHRPLIDQLINQTMYILTALRIDIRCDIWGIVLTAPIRDRKAVKQDNAPVAITSTRFLFRAEMFPRHPDVIPWTQRWRS